jgi:hypothetical protein
VRKTWAAVALIVLLSLAAPAAIAASHTSPQHKHKNGGGEEIGGGGAGGDAATDGQDNDLPLKWLFISLGISALIGAAGGVVFVNLVPPRN